MDEEREVLIATCLAYKKEVKETLRKTLLDPNPKDAKASEELRKEGNDLYLQKIHTHESHEELLRLYNKSAALAPSCSPELAYAYGNRSAFLLHIGKFKECIQDIQKALELTKSDAFKIKLLCRQVECLKKLNCPAYKDVLQEAQSLVDKIDDDDNKKSLEDMMEKFSKLSLAKKVKNDPKSNKTIDLSVTDDVLQKFSIRHNEKYGRHLVAKQNYNPGDIIFVEKLSLSLNPKYHYINCHHCLKICWTGVPCNLCSWAIFCSEDCCQTAWEEYHDVECSLGAFSSKMLYNVPWYSIPVSSIIRILVKAIKDSGGIDNLRGQLEAVDQCTDVRQKGFYIDGKFTSNTIESFFSLTKRKYSAEEMTIISRIVLKILIGLIKHPLMNLVQVRRVNDMIKNKDIMFLGSLLLKLTAVYANNFRNFEHFLCNEEAVINIPSDPRGSCVSTLVSLLNNNCFPNVSLCFTEDGKVIVYALQSMKKNSQMFINYSGEYYCAPLKYRKEYLKKYNFACDCQACVESWPPVLLEYYKETSLGNHASYCDADGRFVKEQCSGTIDILEKDDYREKSLKILASKVTLAFNTLRQPSTFTCILLGALSKCITKIYNGLQPQFYGDCKFLNANSRCMVAAYNHHGDCGHRKSCRGCVCRGQS